MFHATSRYLSSLAGGFGDAWNRFWFTPSDPLTLCLLRILTGLLALYSVATYGPDLVKLFGRDGILPSEVVLQLLEPGEVRWSYLHYLTTADGLWVAHAVGLGLLAAYAAGWLSRVTSIAALVVTLAYIHRGPMLTGPFEPVLTMLLLYLCLAPTGAYLSIDAMLRRRAAVHRVAALPAVAGPPASVSANIATRLIQIHVCLIYVMMAVSKIAEPGETWWQGDAVWWLIAKPESRLVDLTWLHRHPYVINAWSHLIVAFELAFPLFIWWPLVWPIGLILAAVYWFSLALVTGMVPFCLSMMTATLAFLPPAALHSLLPERPGAAHDPLTS
jgi:hypothetical protein